MKHVSRNKTKKLNILILAIILVAVLGLAILIFEKTNVTNIFSRSSVSKTDEGNDPKKVNDVNYDAPSAEETDEANRIKAEAQQKLDSSSPNTNKSIAISLSAAGQDETGGPIIVRSIVDVASGNCVATITGTSYSKSFTASVENLGTYYGCGAINIPVGDMAIGVYKLTFEVSSDGAQGLITQNVEVRK